MGRSTRVFTAPVLATPFEQTEFDRQLPALNLSAPAGLKGESDFNLLGAGWNTNAIYVWNPAPSSRMAAAGLHYTLNEEQMSERSRDSMRFELTVAYRMPTVK